MVAYWMGVTQLPSVGRRGNREAVMAVTNSAGTSDSRWVSTRAAIPRGRYRS